MFQLFLKLPELEPIFNITVDPDDLAAGGLNYYFDLSPSLFERDLVKEFSFDFDDGNGAVFYDADDMIGARRMELESGEIYTDGVSYTVTLTIEDIFGRKKSLSKTFTASEVKEFSSAFGSAFA